jgi:hypothetical protein
MPLRGAVSGPRPELRVDSRDVCFSLDYGWRVLLDPPMPAGRSTVTPPHQSLVRHGAGALWCLQRFGDSRGVKRVDAPAGPGQAGGGFLGRHFRPAALRPRRREVRGPGCEQGPRTGLRMEAFGAQRRRFHVGSLEDGRPGANGSEARSALGQGVVHARRRNVRVAGAGPLP